ncbi:S8 family serine peptidase [Candidatus Peribacteria bacterium]|nr:S8 family serine peptidase [Candidatus Peribacteria bacterium]
MPLRVFDYQGNAKESNIINAMYYAINHKANIINLSLGQSQFAYSNQYDEIMKLAYDNGIIVVIASGN